MIKVNIILLRNLRSEHQKIFLQDQCKQIQILLLLFLNDIAISVKKTDFDDKLKNLNKEVTSNKRNMYWVSKN